MKKLQCEICKSDQIKKISDNDFICEACGMKYSSESVASLLVDVVEQSSAPHESKIEDLLSVMHRHVQCSEWGRACAVADKILAKDPQNPDALLFLGVAAAHRDQSYIKITFPYALDAVKIKKERTQNDDEFYNFLNMALKISFEVLDECLNSANAVELNSYLSYNEKSIQENVRHNEEEFRKAMATGQKYYGRDVTGPTIMDSIGNSILARMEANNVRNNIWASADAGIVAFGEYLETLNLEKLDADGIAGYLIYLIGKQQNSKTETLNYYNLNEQKAKAKEYSIRMESFKKKVSNPETIKAINNLSNNYNATLKKIEIMEKDETFGLAPKFSIFFWLLMPFYGAIAPLTDALGRLFRLRKVAKTNEFPEEVIEKARKKSLVCVGVSIAAFLLYFLLIVVLVSLS